MNNSPTLLLFTGSFPYVNGIGEVFMESELPVLCSYFREVIIFPEQKEGNVRELPPNARVVTLDESGYSSTDAIRKDPVLFLSYLKSIPLARLDLSFYKSTISTFLRLLYRASVLESWLKANMQGIQFVCYSYWFANWATVLSVIKKKRVISSFISRVHGYDLYYEVNKYSFIPARSLQLKYVDKVYSVSRRGYEYLIKNHESFVNKFDWHYLGTRDFYNEHQKHPLNLFTLVSCSSIKEVKRVHLIPQILEKVGYPIRWIHIGGGEQLNTFIEHSKNLPDHICCEFRGQMTSQELFMFYQENFVHLFINVSSSEGLPVSIMEAISCGIPVIATNVGGTGEIVNQATGSLIEAQFDTGYCAKLIEEYIIGCATEKYEQVRQSARQYWLQNFKAEDNFRSFSLEIAKYQNQL